MRRKPGQVADVKFLRPARARPRPLGPSTGQLRALLDREQAEREDEKSRMAHGIHTHLAQPLAVLAMELASLELRMTEPAREASPMVVRQHLQELSELVRGMIGWTRKTRTELRPVLLEQFGLAAALECRCAQLQKQTGIRCAFVAVPEDIPVDLGMAAGLFRIFEAIIANVASHARATSLEARLEAKDSRLHLEVRDNGRGITRAEVASARSLGLAGMREQARRLGGSVRIRGVVGKGTTVGVEVPLAGWAAAPLAAG